MKRNVELTNGVAEYGPGFNKLWHGTIMETDAGDFWYPLPKSFVQKWSNSHAGPFSCLPSLPPRQWQQQQQQRPQTCMPTRTHTHTHTHTMHAPMHVHMRTHTHTTVTTPQKNRDEMSTINGELHSTGGSGGGVWGRRTGNVWALGACTM